MSGDRFKFRVWIIEDIDHGLDFLDGGILKKGWFDPQLRNADKRLYGWYQLSPNGQEIQWGDEEAEEPLIIGRDCVVEFSTGLKDKHGKLIFEGDVVSDFGKRWIVKFGETQVVNVGAGIKQLCFYMENTEDSSDKFFLYELLTLEIIGNVHDSEEGTMKKCRKCGATMYRDSRKTIWHCSECQHVESEDHPNE